MANPRALPLASTDQLEQNALKLLQCLRKTGPVAKALADIFKLLSRLGTQSVEQYCTNELGYSARQFKSAFNQEERNILHGSWNPEDLDVTFINKLLQRCCGLAKPGDPKWTTTGNNLEYNIYCLKQYRNRMAHELIRIDCSEIQDTVRALKRLIEDAFVNVSLLTGNAVHYGNDEAKMKLQDILMTKITTPKTLSDCHNLIRAAKNEGLNFVLWHARQELLSRYSTLKPASPITWTNHYTQCIMDINDLYTELELEDTHSSVTLEEILSLGNVVIIQGLPGSGKSATSVYLANTWSNFNSSRNIRGLDNIDLLLLIQCRYVTVDDFSIYLKDMIIPQALAYEEHKDVTSLLKEARLCICIDGYDEAGPKAKGLLNQIVDLLPESKFIITTRPEFKRDLKEFVKKHLPHHPSKVINILGFNRDNMLKYVKRVFDIVCASTMSNTDKEVSLVNLEKFLQDKQVLLGDLTRMPLTLGLIVILWLENSENLSSASTATDIYEKILNVIICRLVERLHEKTGENRSTNVLYAKCHEWVISLGKEAFEALKSNTTCISASSTKHLENMCDSLYIDRTEIFSSLMISDDQQTTIMKPSLVWSFFHKTLQEYLAALYICHLVTKYNLDICDILTVDTIDEFGKNTKKSIIRNPTQPIIFITGVLITSEEMNSKHATSIVKVANLDSYEILAKIIIESKNHQALIHEIENKNFKIDRVNTDELCLVKIVLDLTKSSLSPFARIEVGKATSDLKEIIEISCSKNGYFKPKLRFKSYDALIATTVLLRNLQVSSIKCTNNFALDLYIMDKIFESGYHIREANFFLPEFPWYILKDINSIRITHPDIGWHILLNNMWNKMRIDDPDLARCSWADSNLSFQHTQQYSNLKYEITNIAYGQLHIAHWLLHNTTCRLSPRVSISSDGLADELIQLLKNHYDTLWYFKPEIKGIKSLNELQKFVDIMQQMGPEIRLATVELRILPSWIGEPTFARNYPPPPYQSISEVLENHPDLLSIVDHPANGNTRRYYQMAISITEVKYGQWPIAMWLLRNSKCTLFDARPTLYMSVISDAHITILSSHYKKYGFQWFSPIYVFKDTHDLLSGAAKLSEILNNNPQFPFASFSVSISFSVPLTLPISTSPPFPPSPDERLTFDFFV